MPEDAPDAAALTQQVLRNQRDIRADWEHVEGLLRKQQSEVAWLESRMKLHRQETVLEERHEASKTAGSAAAQLARVQQEIDSTLQQLGEETRLCSEYKRQTTELQQQVIEDRRRKNAGSGAPSHTAYAERRTEALRSRLQRELAVVSEVNAVSAALRLQIASAHSEKKIFRHKMVVLKAEATDHHTTLEREAKAARASARRRDDAMTTVRDLEQQTDRHSKWHAREAERLAMAERQCATERRAKRSGRQRDALALANSLLNSNSHNVKPPGSGGGSDGASIAEAFSQVRSLCGWADAAPEELARRVVAAADGHRSRTQALDDTRAAIASETEACEKLRLELDQLETPHGAGRAAQKLRLDLEATREQIAANNSSAEEIESDLGALLAASVELCKERGSLPARESGATDHEYLARVLSAIEDKLV
jgi:chromosome segregation ATPase